MSGTCRTEPWRFAPWAGFSCAEWLTDIFTGLGTTVECTCSGLTFLLLLWRSAAFAPSARTHPLRWVQLRIEPESNLQPPTPSHESFCVQMCECVTSELFWSLGHSDVNMCGSVMRNVFINTTKRPLCLPLVDHATPPVVCSHKALQLYPLVIWTRFVVDDLTCLKSNLYWEGSLWQSINLLVKSHKTSRSHSNEALSHCELRFRSPF